MAVWGRRARPAAWLAQQQAAANAAPRTGLRVKASAPARHTAWHVAFTCRGRQQSHRYNLELRRHTLQTAILGQLQRPPAGFEQAVWCVRCACACAPLHPSSSWVLLLRLLGRKAGPECLACCAGRQHQRQRHRRPSSSTRRHAARPPSPPPCPGAPTRRLHFRHKAGEIKAQARRWAREDGSSKQLAAQVGGLGAVGGRPLMWGAARGAAGAWREVLSRQPRPPAARPSPQVVAALDALCAEAQ